MGWDGWGADVDSHPRIPPGWSSSAVLRWHLLIPEESFQVLSLLV